MDSISQDARVVTLLSLANRYLGNPKKLQDVEARLRSVAMSQSLGRGFGQPMSPEQEAVAQQATAAANSIARIIADEKERPKAYVRQDYPQGVSATSSRFSAVSGALQQRSGGIKKSQDSGSDGGS